MMLPLPLLLLLRPRTRHTSALYLRAFTLSLLPLIALLLLLLLAAAAPASAQVASPSSAWQPAPSASGTVASSSSANPNPQWVTTLGDCLYFYDVQRSGVLPADFRVSWRNDSVLTDGASVGVNLSGGFFDAGNFIKAMMPLSWTLTSLSYSALLWGGDAFTKDTAQDYYLDATLRAGLDWILAASSQTDTLYVNIGNQSDAYWGGDQDIPQPRQVYSVDRENPGTDTFAAAATALAAASLVYADEPLPLSESVNGTAPETLKNATYAKILADRAQVLMELAYSATPMQVYQKAVPAVAWAYPSSDYADELVLGSALTALATGNSSWATQALDTYGDNADIYPPSSGVINWDSKGPLLAPTLARLALAMPGADSRLNLTRFQADAETWLDALVSRRMSDLSMTRGGLAYWKAYSSSSSLNPALDAALLCTWYAPLASTPGKTAAYRAWAQTQVDYALGNNPMNTVYAVGLHPNSATNPHSSLAAGGDSLATINTVPPVEAHVLYGGIVGGPGKDDEYYDIRDDYAQTEPALDTAAPMVGLAAYYVSQGRAAADPYYVGLAEARVIPKRTSGGSLSGGAIAGIVIGVVLGLALLAVGAWKLVWQPRRNAVRFHTRKW